MLSILIPTYNFDCTELQQQITASNIELGEKGYSINHIDNPIYNDVPDTDEDFFSQDTSQYRKSQRAPGYTRQTTALKKNRFKNKTLIFLTFVLSLINYIV